MKVFCCTLIFIISAKFVLAQNNIVNESTVNLNTLDNPDSLFVTYFYEPFPQKVGESILQLGGSFILLPTPDVGEYPVPSFDVQFKYGLMKNVSLISSLSTNYFSNLLQSGLQWNTNSSRLSFGLANHIGGFFGSYHLDLFEDVFAYSFMYMPIFRLGIRADEFSASLSLGSTYIFNSGSRVGDLKARGPKAVWNDIFCTMAIEQPMLGRTIISIGLSLEYTRSPYQAWLFFDTIDTYQIIPKFSFAIQL